MRVLIIGSGNVATVLGRKVLSAGHQIVQVVGRNAERGGMLADEFHCPYSGDWAKISPEAAFYLVALTDSALLSFARQVVLPGKLVVHTAGAMPRDVLAKTSVHCGVMYPLQSLRKELPVIPEIPFLVGAGSPADLEEIKAFAGTLSGRVAVADDATRLKLHLGGVLVNNFSNHLYSLAERYCQEEGIDFGLLLPLIKETANRLSVLHPREAMTGPAFRGDEVTMEKHLQLLDNYKDIKELYKLFTFQIQHERFREI